MKIQADILKAILDRDMFVQTYVAYVKDVLGEARLFPKFSIQRVFESHGAWLSDLKRVAEHEPQLEEGMDHFKQCGHLAFWLRRMSPMIDAIDLTQNLADSQGYGLTDAEVKFREILFGYANEYLAFDLGYQICRFHEIAKPGGSPRAEQCIPSVDYYQTMCQFLKYKTVSPHALFLVYKSLFEP